MMHLNDLQSRIDNDGPYEWIYPEEVESIDSTSLKIKNEKKWFRKGLVEEPEGADEIVTDYLYECLLTRKILIDDGKVIPSALYIDSVSFVKSGIYLICEFGSSYAGTHFSSWRELLIDDEASICLDLLTGAYNRSDSFERDILRDFILEIFCYGPIWTPPEGRFSRTLTVEQNHFLKCIFEHGYLTISNKDARFFVDGSKRF